MLMIDASESLFSILDVRTMRFVCCVMRRDKCVDKIALRLFHPWCALVMKGSLTHAHTHRATGSRFSGNGGDRASGECMCWFGCPFTGCWWLYFLFPLVLLSFVVVLRPSPSRWRHDAMTSRCVAATRKQTENRSQLLPVLSSSSCIIFESLLPNGKANSINKRSSDLYHIQSRYPLRDNHLKNKTSKNSFNKNYLFLCPHQRRAPYVWQNFSVRVTEISAMPGIFYITQIF